jgi:hypothetical protein
LQKISREGTGYRVNLPFELKAGKSIKGVDVEQSAAGEVIGHPAQLLKDGYIHILSVGGLSSEKEAGVFLDKLTAGVLWTSLAKVVGIKVGEELYSQIGFGRATVLICNTAQQYFADISAGASLPNAELIVHTPKLKLGSDLYNLSHFQTSDFARFATLCTALEALAPSPAVDPLLVEKISQWQGEARALAGEHPKASEQREALEALAARLDNLKVRSHRQRLRDYVLGVLKADNEEAATDLAKEIVALYDLRGRLLHDGFLEIGTQVGRLEAIMRRTLKAAFQQVGTT